MITQEVNTIDELLQFVSTLYEKHGLRLWYRGEENASLTLVPSIQRSQKRIDAERYITNDFYIRARQILDNPPEKHNYASWVSLMQHYGLPTRMLDWSQSPLVAVFFATETYKQTPDIDACVWVLAPGLLNEREGFGNCIYPIDADTTQEMLLPAFKHAHHNPELKGKILACVPRKTICGCMPSTPTLPSITLRTGWKISVMKICSIKLSFPVKEKNILSKASGFSVSRRELSILIWTIFPVI